MPTTPVPWSKRRWPWRYGRRWLWIQKQILAGESRFLWVRRERARDQVDFAIQPHRHSLNSTDKGVTTAANHPCFEFSFHGEAWADSQKLGRLQSGRIERKCAAF